MIVNKLKTTACWTATFVFVFAVLSMLMTFKAGAFSGLVYSDGVRADVSHNTDAVSGLRDTDDILSVSGPVNITLVLHGQVNSYEFFPVECSEFLQYEGIELGKNDIINVSPDTVLYDNIIIDIGKIEYVTETRVESIPYETVTYESKTIPKGTEQVMQAGTEGEVRRSYIVKYVNGCEQERAMYSETVITLPTEETVARGVGGTVTAADGTEYSYSYYISMEATAYTYVPGKTTMTTATGRTLEKGIVAVDPSVVPLHTKMFVTTGVGEYGVCQAEDTGGAIIGNKIDLAFETYDECIQFGRRNVVAYILE